MVAPSLTAASEPGLIGRIRWPTSTGRPVGPLTAEEVRTLEPAVSPAVRSALRFSGDHVVDNRLLTQALHATSLRAGAHFHEGPVTRIEVGDASARVRTADGTTYDGQWVVLAAG